MELKRFFGIPFVVTFHALGRVRRLHQGSRDTFPSIRSSIEDQIVAEANRIVAECPQDLQDLTDLYSADPGRVVMIPCGFSPSELWPINKAKAREALGLPKDEKILLQLSRIVPRKGVDNGIRGFARLFKHYGIESRLLIVGGESQGLNHPTSPEIRRLMDIAKKEGVFEKVSFLGKRGRDEVRLYYNASDVFVSTPWYEPFGITPIEAMACGTPVVGSNVGGIKFSVVDGETGFLVSPNDPKALAEKLAFLCTHPRERTRMGIRAIKRANRLFTWQRVTERIAATYEETLGERQKPRSAKTELFKEVADSGISGLPTKEALEAE
jgi:glycosyltransferase involved in cell wall biosynthesis